MGRITAVILLLLLVADLVALQVHVFPELKLAAAARELPGTPSSLWTVLRQDGGVDRWGPIVGLGALLGLLAAVQIRGRHLSCLLVDLVDRRRGAWLATTVVAAIGVRYYLDPGLPHQYDAKSHFMRVAETARLLAAGEWPDWTFGFYAGYPLQRFEGPLFYWLAGGVTLLLGSVAASIKLVLALAHVGGALAVLALVRECGGSRRAAFVAGIGAALSFQHTSAIVLNGRLPVSLLYVAFPLTLLVAERLARGVTPGRVLSFGLLVATLVLIHPGLAPYGVLAAVAFLALRSIAEVPRGRRLARSVGGGLLAALVTIPIVAGLIVPALLEREHVRLARMYGGGASGLDLGLFAPHERIADLLSWTLLRHSTVTYVGLSLVALCLLGLLRGGGRKGLRLAVAVVGAGLLALALGGTYLPSRSVHLLVPLLALGAALAVDAAGPRWFAWIVLLLLLDLGPTTFQSPFRPDLEKDRAYLRFVAEREPGRRALRVSLRDGRYAASEWAAVYDTGVPLPTGPFREAASGELDPWLRGLLDRLSDDLNESGSPSAATRLGLRALGCELLLFEDGRGPFLPGLSTPGLSPDPSLAAVRVERSGPAVAVLLSEEIAALRGIGAADWERALATAPPGLREDGDRGIEILGSAAGPREIATEVDVARPGLLVLAAARLPGVVAFLDEEATEIETGPFGLIAVAVEPGPHRIRLAFEAPAYLRWTRLLSVASLAIALLAGVFLLVRRARSDRC